MEQPPDFVNQEKYGHVCLLHKAIYGLKQAPRVWFDRFGSFLLEFGFFFRTVDPSLFIKHSAHGTLVLLLYVDDIILTGSSDQLIDLFIAVLHTKFAMKGLGALHYFLGIEVTSVLDGLVLHQSKYAIDLLDRALMRDCKPIHNPMTQKFKTVTDSIALCDAHTYRSLVGALQYLTLTRPDISFSVNYVSQFMHAPTQDHFTMVRRILRYIKGTVHHGLHIQHSSTLDLYAFSDADWAGYPQI
ncbi:uncharacterized mitochondrial protein AtMg00810-like [Carya illinoinensis]|uniref:uncharacterized mitochondrial protein AtMg00810-like n=1 Tax=Carya illinoinensis TaxID=32201 RepID=UPI001C71FDB5|nr:uncharacterized mitochondrial protein AtMg00810-like [Carya illinoinensis]